MFSGVADLKKAFETAKGRRASGKATLLYGYALGKSQRLLAGLDPAIGPIYTHGAVERMTAVYRAAEPVCGGYLSSQQLDL